MSQQDEQAEQAVGAFTITGPPAPSVPGTRPVPKPDKIWQFPGGTAHVFLAQGHPGGITRPVVVSDGFGLGTSNLEKVCEHLDCGVVPLVTTLRQRGRDVILLGYRERSASLFDNARTVTDCTEKIKTEQIGEAKLVVGGFSMGGLVTRYALASMETRGVDHRTDVYFSFDSPHRGAVIPIGIQAFAHFIPIDNDLARQMNSPAARQMLWRHYDPTTGRIGVAPERTEFLDALKNVGNWPRKLHRIGVANGRGDGLGIPIEPKDVTLKVVKHRFFPGTTFYAQAEGGGAVVAELKCVLPRKEKTVTTDGLPKLDGAPGGSVNAFEKLAEKLTERGGEVDLRHPSVCFIPAVSAVAIRNIDKPSDLYANINELPKEQSELDEFRCSSTTTEHAGLTEELGTWLLDRLRN